MRTGSERRSVGQGPSEAKSQTAFNPRCNLVEWSSTKIKHLRRVTINEKPADSLPSSSSHPFAVAHAAISPRPGQPAGLLRFHRGLGDDGFGALALRAFESSSAPEEMPAS